MKMKYIFRATLCAMAIGALATSCRFEEEDLFEESADLRLDHTNETIEQILCSATSDDPAIVDAQGRYGWVIQYFVSGTDDKKYPGVNIYANFYPNHKVILSGDHSYIPTGAKYTEYTSIWQMIKEEGCVLAFNTWNDILTPLVDPSAEGTEAEGMGGDQNLVLMTYDTNELVFRGERHECFNRFVRLDMPIQQHMQAVKNMKARLANDLVKNYYVVNGKDTMYVTNIASGRPIICERLNDPLFKVQRSCVYTPTGFRNEKPDSVLGQLVQEWKINAQESALNGVGTNMKMIPMWDTYLVSRSATWYFDTESLTEEQKAMVAQIDANSTIFNAKYSLKAIGIGRKNNKPALVATFYKTTARDDKSVIDASIAIDVQRPAYGQYTITALENQKGDSNLQSIEKKAKGTVQLMNDLAASLAGTYNVVPDDYFRPTGGTFTAVDGSQSFIMK